VSSHFTDHSQFSHFIFVLKWSLVIWCCVWLFKKSVIIGLDKSGFIFNEFEKITNIRLFFDFVGIFFMQIQETCDGISDNKFGGIREPPLIGYIQF
jgi:hypothetical protein